MPRPSRCLPWVIQSGCRGYHICSYALQLARVVLRASPSVSVFAPLVVCLFTLLAPLRNQPVSITSRCRHAMRMWLSACLLFLIRLSTPPLSWPIGPGLLGWKGTPDGSRTAAKAQLFRKALESTPWFVTGRNSQPACCPMLHPSPFRFLFLLARSPAVRGCEERSAQKAITEAWHAGHEPVRSQGMARHDATQKNTPTHGSTRHGMCLCLMSMQADSTTRDGGKAASVSLSSANPAMHGRQDTLHPASGSAGYAQNSKNRPQDHYREILLEGPTAGRLLS